MAANKDTLALELRQIIQADRMAADILRGANDTRKDIQADTEKKKAAILTDAEQRRIDMEKQVLAEQQAHLQARKAELQEKQAARRAALDKMMADNREKWIEEITGRITSL